MKMNKRVSVLILSMIFLFTPVLLNTCTAAGLPLTKVDSNPHSYEGAQNDHQATCHNKVSCSNNNHHCNLLSDDKISWLFGLDSYPLSPLENLLPSQEIANSLFHPPRPSLH